MGLINNLLISVVHLVFVAMDILLLMILIKVIYERWQISWLKQIMKVIEPPMTLILNYVRDVVMRITGKKYSEKILLLLTIACLSLARFIISGFL